MPQPAFEVKNLDQAIAAFAGAPAIVEIELGQAVDTILGLAADRLAVEPPPPGGSRYVRSHRLSSGWQNQKPRFVVAGNSKTAVLRNDTPYARWVQSRADQAAVHRDRWGTVEAVQEALAAEADRELAAAGDRALNRIAGAI